MCAKLSTAEVVISSFVMTHSLRISKMNSHPLKRSALLLFISTLSSYYWKWQNGYTCFSKNDLYVELRQILTVTYQIKI